MSAAAVCSQSRNLIVVHDPSDLGTFAVHLSQCVEAASSLLIQGYAAIPSGTGTVPPLGIFGRSTGTRSQSREALHRGHLAPRLHPGRQLVRKPPVTRFGMIVSALTDIGRLRC